MRKMTALFRHVYRFYSHKTEFMPAWFS